MTVKARGTHSRPRIMEDDQKTNGFNRKAEKNTSISRPETKWGIFREVKKWKARCTEKSWQVTLRKKSERLVFLVVLDC